MLSNYFQAESLPFLLQYHWKQPSTNKCWKSNLGVGGDILILAPEGSSKGGAEYSDQTQREFYFVRVKLF